MCVVLVCVHGVCGVCVLTCVCTLHVCGRRILRGCLIFSGSRVMSSHSALGSTLPTIFGSTLPTIFGSTLPTVFGSTFVVSFLLKF